MIDHSVNASEAAETALTMLQAANPETPVMIEPEQIYPVQGLGRGPDLH